MPISRNAREIRTSAALTLAFLDMFRSRIEPMLVRKVERRLRKCERACQKGLEETHSTPMQAFATAWEAMTQADEILYAADKAYKGMSRTDAFYGTELTNGVN